MSDYSFEQLVRQLFEATKQVDIALDELKSAAASIEEKYEPRTEFNRWRKSHEGKLWKQQQYKIQKGLCAICRQPIEFKGSHIDHKQPLSKYPQLALEPKNLRITCPDCNVSKGSKYTNYNLG
ncbi:HNH endonuclease [Mastigocoleus testarum]|uniref:HNH nuclease domain-containing protein n=1 Tax=Mastigocoleus testarum BC008 TaxID=371196 RepID=A0A0V7ZZ87_9CYAN|nr:HNH endonuclease [Mastigocoleus testarum]KST67613.1 hypothetical protein BC008_30940 [Mastigocoleus testarum BC008]KST69751.1 hypothetical protein BC008_35910 [Mastigocoleus testarum BC008]